MSLYFSWSIYFLLFLHGSNVLQQCMWLRDLCYHTIQSHLSPSKKIISFLSSTLFSSGSNNYSIRVPDIYCDSINFKVTVLYSPTVMGGGWVPIKDPKDPEVVKMANYAINKHNKMAETDLKFERVIKGEEQLVAGMNYKLIIAAQDDNAEHEYESYSLEVTGVVLSFSGLQCRHFLLRQRGVVLSFSMTAASSSSVKTRSGTEVVASSIKTRSGTEEAASSKSDLVVARLYGGGALVSEKAAAVRLELLLRI